VELTVDGGDGRKPPGGLTGWLDRAIGTGWRTLQLGERDSGREQVAELELEAG